ncbi:MAG: ANTAR domain-containing protein [Acidobacteria bacterium]|nr:ANTAR domain-containing protein [Acidobacteriota bacterium]
MLRREAGGVIFRAEPGGELRLNQAEVYEFLNSVRVCKMLYTVPLIEQGQQLGWLVAAFADPPLALDVPHRLARFAGQQLGSLLVRSNPRARRPSPVEKLEDHRGDMAGASLYSRALELLVGRHKLSVAEAKEWLEAESRRTGRAREDIAERLVQFHSREARLSA